MHLALFYQSYKHTRYLGVSSWIQDACTKKGKRGIPQSQSNIKTPPDWQRYATNQFENIYMCAYIANSTFSRETIHNLHQI